MLLRRWAYPGCLSVKPGDKGLCHNSFRLPEAYAMWCLKSYSYWKYCKIFPVISVMNGIKMFKSINSCQSSREDRRHLLEAASLPSSFLSWILLFVYLQWMTMEEQRRAIRNHRRAWSEPGQNWWASTYWEQPLLFSKCASDSSGLDWLGLGLKLGFYREPRSCEHLCLKTAFLHLNRGTLPWCPMELPPEQTVSKIKVTTRWQQNLSYPGSSVPSQSELNG